MRKNEHKDGCVRNLNNNQDEEAVGGIVLLTLAVVDESFDGVDVDEDDEFGVGASLVVVLSVDVVEFLAVVVAVVDWVFLLLLLASLDRKAASPEENHPLPFS